MIAVSVPLNFRKCKPDFLPRGRKRRADCGLSASFQCGLLTTQATALLLLREPMKPDKL